jgi:uncharacterized protein YllA (UPF0747 family)
VIPRIVHTPIAPLELPQQPARPRRIAADVIASILPGPGRDRLAQGEVLAVTTGQQPGLFTGPLYTIYKALSSIALARRLERERGVPVVPVFWVAGDDHDFVEASHTWFLNSAGDAERIVLRQRPGDAPLVPLAREPCGPEIRGALAQLRDGTPDTEFKAAALEWLERWYRPDATLAEAFAEALNALLAPRGLAVLRAHDPRAKREAAPWVLRALAVTLPDGYTPVFVDATQGRDRLQADGTGFVTRRSGERFTRADLERIAGESPERLSPNVLLRPVIEAALLPTVAYAAGPAELTYLRDAAPLYEAVGGVARQPPVPRWSGVIVEGRVERLMQRHGLELSAFDGKPGELEARLVRHDLPPETVTTLAALRRGIEEHYGHLVQSVVKIDPTLERTVESARNAALAGTQAIEKKLVASLKRSEGETLVRQIMRARAAVYPQGQPQERVLTLVSFVIRHGPGLVDALAQEVARWADAS